MLKNIIKGYGQLIASVLKVLFLLLLCAGLGAAFVFPLWKIATDLPQTYTFAVLSIIVILFGVYLFKRVKAAGLKNSLIFTARLFIIAAGISISVFLVMKGLRFMAIPVLAAMILGYGFFSFGLKQNKITRTNDETAEL